MSYIGPRLLTQELRRLHEEAGHPADLAISVEEIVVERVRFRATIGDKKVNFSVRDDDLASASLRYVADTYLRPLVRSPAS